ncbi:class Ib ribonucleoside-diphosphate reductase assembly flavoprotein NrdI [Halomonas sp. G15]|nr:class Ib ribonucleoside-diphosphate reductase assembly flavoprotein NrdI [Halomonas sp. G15]
MAAVSALPPELIYFSTRSGNTHRFVERLGLPARRIPLERGAPTLEATSPFILVTPTYGGGEVRGAVPAPVIRFLNDDANRALLRGVIAAGNTNFGAAYGLAGRIIAEKCGVPLLYRFELLGTDEDVTRVRKGVREFWTRPS